MRALSLATAVAAGLIGLPALAQQSAPWRGALPVEATSHAGGLAAIVRVADQRTVTAGLPGPALGENAGPQDFLRAAQGALAAGRSREAQQALEMAQTRMLDRSVPFRQTTNPSDDPGVARVSQALRALAAGDRAGCMTAIQAALSASP